MAVAASRPWDPKSPPSAAAPVRVVYELSALPNPVNPMEFRFLAAPTEGEAPGVPVGWDFGDGVKQSTGSGQAEHTFASAGEYTVTAVVEGKRITQTVTVR